MIPVFFVDEMSAPNVESYSRSAGKPARVVRDWRTDFDTAPDIEIREFDPISRDVIALAHDPAYVADVLAGRRDNGFGNRDRRVAASLPYTTGSMLAAARHVLAASQGSGPRIACSPSSGFHHAHHASGGDFCTFNGLMVTALALKTAGLVERVLVLDCDQHYGDGTQDIIDTLGLASWVTHVTHDERAVARGRLAHGYAGRAAMVSLIQKLVPTFADGGVVLYQAGADCHVDDPLGGFLTTWQMRERDRLVFDLAVRHGVPLVWNLAGGYQVDHRNDIGPVLALHRQTMGQCILAHAARPKEGPLP